MISEREYWHNFFASLIAALFGVVGLYAFGSFANWSFDPNDWNGVGRAVIGALILIWVVLVISLGNEEE